MLTPQDLQEVGFQTAKFGGYVKTEVDEFLSPLMDDYVNLYKENAVLKSKMRLLVERLEDYRAGENRMKAAVEETQRTCDGMIAEARRKSEELLQQAREEVQSKTRDIDTAVAGENERLRLAKEAAAAFVSAVEDQIARHQQILETLKGMDLPKERTGRRAYDYEAEKDPMKADASDIAAQIEQNVGRITGDYPQADPKAATRVMPPLDLDERTSAKFANLKFGKNYQP